MSCNKIPDELTYELVDRSIHTGQNIEVKFIVCYQCECVLKVTRPVDTKSEYESKSDGKALYEIIPIICGSCSSDKNRNSFIHCMASSSSVFISSILAGRAVSAIRVLYNCDLYCKKENPSDSICNIMNTWDLIDYITKYNTTEYPIQCTKHKLHYRV